MTSWLKRQVMNYEQSLLYKALEKTGGHQGQAAKLVGIEAGHFSVKLHRDRQRYPDPRWNDPPLAWAIRKDSDRVKLAPCWTRSEITADAEHHDTIAFCLDEGEARRLVQTVNTTLAVRAAAGRM